ncbi:MAG: hypothetical protein ABR616_03495 [Dermatophilaceae bacterium]
MNLTVSDVAMEMARSTPEPPVYSQWQSWIDRAYRLVEARLGAGAYATADTRLVDDVVLQAVVEHVRAWRDTAASQYTVCVDDASTSRTYQKPGGLLEIPNDLWPLLGVAASQSFTIEP